jgi:pimeloyl-ACP methyl ester carboxylesterase
MRKFLSILAASIALAQLSSAARAFAQDEKVDMSATAIQYRTIQVDGLSIFYREAGPKDAPTILLLHGFPSSSRMFSPLFERLSSKYHLIAPDYPGFGHSDHPAPSSFSYTFDHIATVMDDFTAAIGLSSYSLYLQDYGGPVGFRLAYESALRANFSSLEATRQRHLGNDSDISRYDPDLWTDEFAFLSQSGEAQIQSDLFYDYRTNVASYPAWQAWLRSRQPRLLVLWGKYDPSFQVAEAAAYQRDVKNADVHILDAGHFALDTNADQIATIIDHFLSH